jgi:hypothetical protein
LIRIDPDADYVKEEKAPKKDGEFNSIGGALASLPWIQRIQDRRNTIHAYKKREIGSFEEWRADLRIHLKFIRELNSRFPYPD